jgi:hypothetical protein
VGGRDRWVLGAISFFHRVGAALNPHFHFHLLASTASSSTAPTAPAVGGYRSVEWVDDPTTTVAMEGGLELLNYPCVPTMASLLDGDPV